MSKPLQRISAQDVVIQDRMYEARRHSEKSEDTDKDINLDKKKKKDANLGLHVAIAPDDAEGYTKHKDKDEQFHDEQEDETTEVCLKSRKVSLKPKKYRKNKKK